MYNGLEYKLIKHEAAGISLLLGFASKNKIGCPGPGINCTSFLSIIENDGSVAFDLRPESFECLCEGKKAKRLDHYVFPRYLQGKASSSLVILLANTLFPGDKKQGEFFFRGKCADYVLRVPIKGERQQFVFEFPFSGER